MTLGTVYQLRQQFQSDYLTQSELTHFFGSSTAFQQKTSRMVTAGELQRLKRGHFVFAPEHRRGAIDLLHIANFLYGPSYVSCESALSYYGLIPEYVANVVSVNTKRTKTFDTEIASFFYRKIPESAFASGYLRRKNIQYVLLATPEKALLDKLYLDGPQENYYAYSVEGLRIEEKELQGLKRKELLTISKQYNSDSFSRRVSAFAEDLEEA